MKFPIPARGVGVGGVCAAALLASAGGAHAATLRAAPGGLQAALAAAAPGDVVELQAGTFRDVVAVPSYAADVTIRPAPGASVTLATPRLTGGRHLRLEDLRFRGISVSGTADLTIAASDFTVSGAFFAHTDRLVLRDNAIHDAYDGFVIDDAAGFTIDGNECTRVPVASRKQSGDCLQMARTSDWSITRNHFHDQPSKPHADAIEITDNNYDGVIARNLFVNVRGIVFTPGDNTPIRSQYRMTVVNNVFSRTRDMAFNGVRMNDSAFLYNTAPDGGYVQFGGASGGNTVVGNIMKAFRVDPKRAATYVPREDYNLIASTLAGYRRGAHDLTGTAAFVNAAAGDYRLAAGSKGAGAAERTFLPADDFMGAPRLTADLGAYAMG